MPHSVRPTAVRPPTRRRAVRAAAALALAALPPAGCGKDLLEAQAQYNVDTVATTYVAYPISTAPAPLNTALSIGGFAPVRPAIAAASYGTGTILVPNFDFAVDRGADGRVRLLPSKLIAGLTGTGRVLRTGLQPVNTPYDSLLAAPNSGTYQRDSATVVTPGQAIAVETESATCLTSSRNFIYAKLVLDSISPSTGGAYFRAVIDPNCGYRSLRPGRPTS